MTSKRILVVDDNAIVRGAVARILSGQAGWEVCGEASSGEEALLKTGELHPDLVLLDVSMPGMDGLETARRLRESTSNIQILIMSHHDPARLEASAIAAGADGCLDKGRLGTDLVSAVDLLPRRARPTTDQTSR